MPFSAHRLCIPFVPPAPHNNLFFPLPLCSPTFSLLKEKVGKKKSVCLPDHFLEYFCLIFSIRVLLLFWRKRQAKEKCLSPRPLSWILLSDLLHQSIFTLLKEKAGKKKSVCLPDHFLEYFCLIFSIRVFLLFWKKRQAKEKCSFPRPLSWIFLSNLLHQSIFTLLKEKADNAYFLF